MGVTAIAAGLIASGQSESSRWLLVWLAEACVALAIGIVALRVKTRATGQAFWSRPARKFALAFAPPVAAAAVLTIALCRAGAREVMPGMWLALYGVAVMGAGAFSISAVPLMGAAFVLLGSLALLLPSFGSPALIFGFGVVHVLFGLIIARRHGG